MTATFAVAFLLLAVLELLDGVYGDRSYLDFVLWLLIAAANAVMAVLEYRKQRTGSAAGQNVRGPSD